MALLKVSLPKALRGNRSLEAIFYHKFKKLNLIPYGKFYPLEVVASSLDLSLFATKNYLIRSKKMHGIELNGNISVHPIEVMRTIKAKARRIVLKNLIELKDFPIFSDQKIESPQPAFLGQDSYGALAPSGLHSSKPQSLPSAPELLEESLVSVQDGNQK